MSRRPAIVTQADVARTVRAAKQAGAAGVEIRPDGTMLVVFSTPMHTNPQPQIDPERKIEL